MSGVEKNYKGDVLKRLNKQATDQRLDKAYARAILLSENWTHRFMPYQIPIALI